MKILNDVESAEKNLRNQLHEEFVAHGANAKMWMRKCALLLPKIEQHRVWDRGEFRSIYEYAAKLAGMTREAVNNSLRILKKVEDMPEIIEVIKLKGISAVKPIENVVTVESANFWAGKVRIMSKHTLETYVKEMRKSGGSQRPGTLENGEFVLEKAVLDFSGLHTAKIVDMELAPEVFEKLAKLKGQGSWNDLMTTMLAERERGLAENKPAAVAATSRPIPAKIKKHVLARTNGTCAFSGCLKPNQILHHTPRLVLEKMHDPDRIEALCKAHERLAHLSLIENEDGPASGWRVRKEPDVTSPKYAVDLIVNKFRHGAA